MLHSSQKPIAIENPRRFRRRQCTDGPQSANRVVDVASADGPVHLSMQQLQELHQIFDIANASPTDLQFRIIFSGRTALEDFLPTLKFLDLFQIKNTYLA